MACALLFQLFNGTFGRAMEAGGVEMLTQKLEKFFYRVKPYTNTPLIPTQSRLMMLGGKVMSVVSLDTGHLFDMCAYILALI